MGLQTQAMYQLYIILQTYFVWFIYKIVCKRCLSLPLCYVIVEIFKKCFVIFYVSISFSIFVSGVVFLSMG